MSEDKTKQVHKVKPRTYDRQLLKKAKRDNDSRVIWGFDLPKPLYKVCLAELRTYDYLKRNFASIVAYGERLTHYEDCVDRKINLELRLRDMDAAFDAIPTKYHAPMRYMITTDDNESEQRYKLQQQYELEWKDAKEWLHKLVYFYAEYAGYPVSHGGKGYTMAVDDDGSVEIVFL